CGDLSCRVIAPIVTPRGGGGGSGGFPLVKSAPGFGFYPKLFVPANHRPTNHSAGEGMFPGGNLPRPISFALGVDSGPGCWVMFCRAICVAVGADRRPGRYILL